jgi:hypothetical protein
LACGTLGGGPPMAPLPPLQSLGFGISRWRLQGNATLGLRAGGRGHHVFLATRESAPGGSPHGAPKAYCCARSSPLKAKKWRVLAFSVLYRSGAPVPRPLIGMPRSAGECCRRLPTPSCCSAGGLFPQSCRRATTCIRSFETRISILVSRSPLLVSSVKTSAS